MSEQITVCGIVATDLRHINTAEGMSVSSFRLASGQGRFDTKTNSWVDQGTNWYSVSSFRQLATNSAASLRKGDRVIVTGKLRISEWEKNERTGLNIEIEAAAIGQNLKWGNALFQRMPAEVSGSGATKQIAGASTPKVSDVFGSVPVAITEHANDESNTAEEPEIAEPDAWSDSEDWADSSPDEQPF